MLISKSFSSEYVDMRHFALKTICLLFLFICFTSSSEEPLKSGKTIRFHPSKDKSSASGLYVPKDLNDCLDEFERILPQWAITEMKNSDRIDMIERNLDLRIWIENKWVWKRSRLSKWFKSIGLQYPIGMSEIILSSFWLKLNNKPIELEGQVKSYQFHRELIENIKNCPYSGVK